MNVMNESEKNINRCYYNFGRMQGIVKNAMRDLQSYVEHPIIRSEDRLIAILVKLQAAVAVDCHDKTSMEFDR